MEKDSRELVRLPKPEGEESYQIYIRITETKITKNSEEALSAEVFVSTGEYSPSYCCQTSWRRRFSDSVRSYICEVSSFWQEK